MSAAGCFRVGNVSYPYSIQTLKRWKPRLFRQDLITLFDLLQQQRIKPLIAQRVPLSEARQAHELLGKGGVAGKLVLVPRVVARVRSGVTSGCRLIRPLTIVSAWLRSAGRLR